jgi:hypothetical protein
MRGIGRLKSKNARLSGLSDGSGYIDRKLSYTILKPKKKIH